MPSNTELISIIVPIYNAELFLDQCLSSISAQTYDNLEIICLNDGSTDASLPIIRRHAQEDPRIRVVDKPNQGYGATCNRGIAEARGEWIAIVEPDDWIESGMYADMISFAKEIEKPVDIIKTPYWRIRMPDTPQQEQLNCSYRKRVKPRQQPFALEEAVHLIAHHPSIWSALYRKEFLDRKGIRFREYPGAGWADNPFLLETFCQTEGIAYLDTPYYCYREESPQKASASIQANPTMPLERWIEMQDVLDRLDISSKAVEKAHIERGFTYLRSVIKEIGWPNQKIDDLVKRMLERMDAGTVFSSAAISAEEKRLFAETRGLAVPPNARRNTRHALHLASNAAYSIRNNGLKFALGEIARITGNQHAGK